MKLHPAFTQSSLSSLPAAANRSGHQVDKKSPFYLPPNAMDQFWHDTAGVYVPKIPTWRSHIQAFKDTFLEFVEDGAFYFSIPLMGPLLARAYVDIQKLEPMLKKFTSNFYNVFSMKTCSDINFLGIILFLSF